MLSSDQSKADIRTAVLALRDAKPEGWRVDASKTIARHIAGVVKTLRGGPVAGYWPFGSEADPRPLMQAIVASGFELCLPVIKHPEIFYRKFVFGDRMADAGWGTLGPMPDAPEVTPAALLVPLAAFDARGGRIGWGKGHYDRSIARLAEAGTAPVTIGIAFGFQQVDQVPVEPHDQNLDYIVTEQGLIGREMPERSR